MKTSAPVGNAAGSGKSLAKTDAATAPQQRACPHAGKRRENR